MEWIVGGAADRRWRVASSGSAVPAIVGGAVALWRRESDAIAQPALVAAAGTVALAGAPAAGMWSGTIAAVS
jgi:hypothetical protein